MNQDINLIFRTISNTKILGILPLDLILHFIVGALLTIIGQIRKINLKWTILIILILSLIKEYLDSSTMTSSVSESLKDIATTMIYPILIFIVVKIKKN